MAWCGAMGTRRVRTNPHHSRCVTLLLPTLALRAFLGVSPIGTERRAVSYLSVLEMRPLLSPCCCASLASPPEQQVHMQMMAASFCALLTAPLLLAVPADPSSHHGCVDGVEKAYQELQFVWRRPRTAEIRCSRGAPSAPRIFAVQFKFTDETVAVSHQHARCCLRDELGSSVTTSAGSSYRSAATHMCVACVAMHSCVLCRLLKVGAIFSAIF